MNDPSQISIRSPHTRGDPYYSATSALDDYFNPLPSHEGRPCPYPACIVPNPFQSTPLIRGETVGGQIQVEPVLFQSTPLIRGETHDR